VTTDWQPTVPAGAAQVTPRAEVPPVALVGDGLMVRCADRDVAIICRNTTEALNHLASTRCSGPGRRSERRPARPTWSAPSPCTPGQGGAV